MLLLDGESQFSSLVEQSGTGEAEHLRILANSIISNIKSDDEQSSVDQDDDDVPENGEKDPLLV